MTRSCSTGFCYNSHYAGLPLLPDLAQKCEYSEIFGEKRFDELCSADRPTLLSDFLYHTREAYNANFKIYTLLSRGLRISLILVVLDLIIFALFISAYVIG